LPFAFCLAGYIRNDRVHHHLNKKKNTPQRDESRRNVSAWRLCFLTINKPLWSMQEKMVGSPALIRDWIFLFFSIQHIVASYRQQQRQVLKRYLYKYFCSKKEWRRRSYEYMWASSPHNGW
jgi:hypothetical protein